MITPSFSLTATERVLPKLALDFTTGLLDPRITFTRTVDATHPATYVNSSGLITAATNNQPRFDYDPVTLACKGLLIEESRTNSLFDSGLTTFTTVTNNNVWIESATQLDTTINSAISPSGANDATLLSINTATSFKPVTQRTAIASAGTYSLSVYAKPNSTDKSLTLLLTGEVAVTNYVTVVFNLSGNGSAGTPSVVGTATSSSTPNITYVGNGWYRCSIQVTLAAPTNITAYIYPGNRAAQTTATQTLVWGAQLEAGAFATSYIPTTTAALTRNADVAVMTGTNFSDWFNAGNGAFGCSILPKTASGVKPVLQCDDATALNTIVMQGNATSAEMKITTLAVLQSTLSTGTITANTAYGSCGAWTAGSNALSKSGGVAITGSPVSIPTVTQSRLGSDGTNYFNGWLQKINYWPQRLTNSEVQAFSK